jgi:hypothetical protein
MPLIYEDDSIINGDLWFPSKCAIRNGNTEENQWNLRHVALFVSDWTVNAQPDYDWIESDAGVGAQCDVVTDLRHGSGEAREVSYPVAALKLKTDHLRAEFEALSKKWYRDTRHLSLISKKVAHPAYLRIVGMGEAAIPLLLEALRDKPTHWFVALRATANTDPSSPESNPIAS